MMFNISPNWPAPSNVCALVTTRQGGVSPPPFAQNNLALHVGDQERWVDANRQHLIKRFHLPAEPHWLIQTHTTEVVIVEEDHHRTADAALTRQTNVPLAILTADCLPILLCNKQGSEIAAIHAGWRGLYGGIIENTLSKMLSTETDLLAWIGPAICQNCYEVEGDILKQFARQYDFAQLAFKVRGKKYLCNLPLLAEKILHEQQVLQVYHANLCTFEQKNLFYSYRREAQTGRIASLIWLKN